MGDMANMTSCHGEVNGPRLLRWLRSRAEMYREKEAVAKAQGYTSSWYAYSGRAAALEEMADDLAAELTPPDYPGDDGAEVDLDDPALGGIRPPCPVCGGSVVRGPQDADDLCVRCSPNP